MKTTLILLWKWLMAAIFVGGVYWITAALDDPQKALAISIKIGYVTQSPYFIPIFLGSVTLIIFLVLIPVLWRSHTQNQLRERLLKEGIQTTAEIIRIDDTGITFNKNPRIKITVAVLDKEASFELTVSRVNVPRVGESIAVLYDPDNPSQAVPVYD